MGQARHLGMDHEEGEGANRMGQSEVVVQELGDPHLFWRSFAVTTPIWTQFLHLEKTWMVLIRWLLKDGFDKWFSMGLQDPQYRTPIHSGQADRIQVLAHLLRGLVFTTLWIPRNSTPVELLFPVCCCCTWTLEWHLLRFEFFHFHLWEAAELLTQRLMESPHCALSVNCWSSALGKMESSCWPGAQQWFSRVSQTLFIFFLDAFCNRFIY